MLLFWQMRLDWGKTNLTSKDPDWPSTWKFRDVCNSTGLWG